ncbi:hypothetical protein Tco_0531975 [Tanacetum coccineum]
MKTEVLTKIAEVQGMNATDQGMKTEVLTMKARVQGMMQMLILGQNVASMGSKEKILLVHAHESGQVLDVSSRSYDNDTVSENNSDITFDIPNMDPDRGKEEHDDVNYEQRAFFASLINNLKCDVEKCNKVNSEAQQANALLKNELERYKKKEKHFAKDMIIDSKYCKKIKLLNVEISNLKSQACEKDKTFAKENEKYTDQTLRMLLPKEYNVNTGKQGLAFKNQNDNVNPSVLNKAKELAPCFYNTEEMGKDEFSDHKIISEEELKCEAEKQMKDDLKYVMSLEDEFDETCLILDIQQEFFKTQFESAISKSHSHVYENEMFEQNSSLKNENRCLKMTISQIQKDFSKMEAQSIAFEIALQHKIQENNSLKTMQTDNKNFVASLQIENTHLKQAYKDLFESIQNSRDESNKYDDDKLKFDFDKIETQNIELEHKLRLMGKLIEKLLLNQKCMGYLVRAYYSSSPTRYYKDDSCWSADLKSKTTEDIISIGSFMEVLVLNKYINRFELKIFFTQYSSQKCVQVFADSEVSKPARGKEDIHLRVFAFLVLESLKRGKLIQKLLLNQKCMGYLVRAYYSISPTRYYKDDSCWSADLKSKTTEDIISIGSFVEVLVLNQYVLVRKIFFETKIKELEMTLAQQTKDFEDAKVDFSKKTDKFETYFEKIEKTKVVLEHQLDRKIQDSNTEKD